MSSSCVVGQKFHALVHVPVEVHDAVQGLDDARRLAVLEDVAADGQARSAGLDRVVAIWSRSRSLSILGPPAMTTGMQQASVTLAKESTSPV
jgi:hypothetical protein